MDELQVALILIVPLALFSVGFALYHILKTRKQSQEQALSILEQEESKGQQQSDESQEEIPEDTSKFWNIEKKKENQRHEVFKLFIPEQAKKENKPQQEAPKQPDAMLSAAQDHNFKTKNYSIRHLQKITDSQSDINEQLSKIKDIHKDTPLSRLRKLSKKPNQAYLSLLMHSKKDPEPKKKEKPDPINRLASLPDKRSRILNKLKKIHH